MLDLAAALTYYAVLALFPAMLAVISLLGLIGQDQQGTDALMQMIRGVAPNAADTLQGVVTQLTQSQSSGFTLVIGIVGALWSASGYVGAFGRAMNRIYEIDEGGPSTSSGRSCCSSRSSRCCSPRSSPSPSSYPAR